MNGLVPCPACRRHVRRNETACPFCGAAVTEAIARTPERAMPTVRLGRSALFVFAAASVGAASCGGDVNAETSKTRVNEDAAANGGSSSSGGQLGIPFYGAPFPSGGMTGAGGTGGQFGVVLYGAPFPSGDMTGAGGEAGGTTGADAGKDDAAAGGAGGNFGAPHYGGPPQSLYGAPPAPK